MKNVLLTLAIGGVITYFIAKTYKTYSYLFGGMTLALAK